VPSLTVSETLIDETAQCASVAPMAWAIRVIESTVLVVCNLTPVPRLNYRLGVPRGGYWREILNSDAPFYGGSGLGNHGGADATPMPYEDFAQSLSITVPPLAVLFFKPE